MLELTKKANRVAITTSHIRSIEATLCRAKSLGHEDALFVNKMGCSQTSNFKGDSTKGESQGWKSQGIVCHGCGEKGHIKPKCRNRNKWSSYAEGKMENVDENVATTELTPAANTE
jgi:hypothetical protein